MQYSSSFFLTLRKTLAETFSYSFLPFPFAELTFHIMCLLAHWTPCWHIPLCYSMYSVELCELNSKQWFIPAFQTFLIIVFTTIFIISVYGLEDSERSIINPAHQITSAAAAWDVHNCISFLPSRKQCKVPNLKLSIKSQTVVQSWI